MSHLLKSNHAIFWAYRECERALRELETALQEFERALREFGKAFREFERAFRNATGRASSGVFNQSFCNRLGGIGGSRFPQRASRWPHVCRMGCMSLERHNGPLGEVLNRELSR